MRVSRSIMSVVSVVLVMAAFGCGGGQTPVPVEIRRFDRAAVEYAHAGDSLRSAIEAGYESAIGVLRSIFGGGDDGGFMQDYADSRAVEVFAPDIEKRLPDLGDAQLRLGALRDGLGRVLPGMRFPSEVYGAVIPFNQSVVVADSIVIVGLNHYLGADYEGYAGFEGYRRNQKELRRMALDVAEALIGVSYPYIGSERSTVLSRLLYEGAVINAIVSADEDLTVADALGYTEDEYRWAQTHERDIWNAVISSDMLYSTDAGVAHRLVAPAPSTPLVNANAPGRIGRYTGYRIVRAYMEKNPDTDIEFTLTPGFYDSLSTLPGSEYAPE